MIGERDLTLFRYVESPDEVLAVLKKSLSEEMGPRTPAFAKTTCCGRG
jgi:hypothetical protein